MQKRPITHIFIINPPQLGKRRRKIFDAQFAHWQKPLPPRTYSGVDKNHLDMEGWQYKSQIRDDRSLWIRLKLRWGLEPRAVCLVQRYGALFGPKTARQPISIGHTACAISHIKVLERIGQFPENELCMVVEDDALLNPVIAFDGIAWPDDAAFLHLWPGGINRYEKYSDDYVRIRKKWSSEEGANWTMLGYVVSPVGARAILSDIVPVPVNRTVDTHILYGSIPELFAVRNPWVRPFFVTSSLIGGAPVMLSFIRWGAYHLRFLLPASILARHPNLAARRTRPRFDTPRLD